MDFVITTHLRVSSVTFLFPFCLSTPQGKTNFTPQCHPANLRCEKRGVFLLIASQQMALMGNFLHMISTLEMIQMVQLGISSGKILLVTQSPAQPWTPVWSWFHPSFTHKCGPIPQQGRGVSLAVSPKAYLTNLLGLHFPISTLSSQFLFSELNWDNWGWYESARKQTTSLTVLHKLDKD